MSCCRRTSRTSSLAVSGAVEKSQRSPVLSYGRQCIDDDDVRAVLDVLQGDWLTQGPAVERFETALSDYFGARHVIACSNGTAALHLAALALGWQAGDVVIVPAITFLASANCAVYVGAEPFFVDIDDRSLTIDVDEVERSVLALRQAGRRVRAVVGVDMAGHPCDWLALRALADRYDLHLVDDACHAMGATYADGERIGSGRDVDLTTLSFHPVKHITTGEGGAVLTNDDRLAEHVRRLRSHGTVRGETQIAAWEGPWQLDMVEPGFNYRMTDMQAALGTSQLRKLDRFVERRQAIATQYGRALAGSPFRLPSLVGPVTHAHHLYVVRAAFGDALPDRREFFARCLEHDLQLQVHYRPLPMNTWYRGQTSEDLMARLPVSRRYYAEAISLPIYQQLTDADVARVAGILTNCAT